MTDAIKTLATGSPSFKKIITLKSIYVDKTAYLAKMISSNNQVWFLSRPRRFGKSVTVSTFESIFSGNKELFKGLAIEENLDDERFAPRPVIRLDMSKLAMSRGIDKFERSLKDVTVRIAKAHGITLSLESSPNILFTELIEECASKYGTQVAILIDEYDTPVTDLLNTPNEAEEVRKLLREYYRQLKSCDDYISFIFVTGITKFVQGGLYSAFNNPTDISNMPEFGAITGFTHEELKEYFAPHIILTAESLGLKSDKLLEKMKNYYNGFCFDSQTLVYNPFSTLHFFVIKKFRNFWFNSATPDQLVTFMRNKHLNFDDFAGIQILQERIINPSANREQDPATYLYQLGYLSLRPGESEDEFGLDYPNTEVRESMALRLLQSYFPDNTDPGVVCKRVRKVALQKDPAALVAEINMLLARIPYEDFGNEPHDEYFYRSYILTLVYAAGLEPYGELHSNAGRFDIFMRYGDHVWILELKVCHEGAKNDETLAENALKQIKEKNYSVTYIEPVILGLVINDEARLVSTWRCEGGLLARPEAKNEAEQKPKAKAKAEQKPKAKAEQKPKARAEQKPTDKEEEGTRPRPH